jgi:hypothetical protein
MQLVEDGRLLEDSLADQLPYIVRRPAQGDHCSFNHTSGIPDYQ